MPGRNFSSDEYRYGFQGQEKDDEVKGEGNSINYKYRMHDPRIGRFAAIDPLFKKYPFYSPYAFSGNRVIDAVEQEGLQPAQQIRGTHTGAPALIIPASDKLQVPIEPGGLDYISDDPVEMTILDQLAVQAMVGVVDLGIGFANPWLAVFKGEVINDEYNLSEVSGGDRVEAAISLVVRPKGSKGAGGVKGSISSKKTLSGGTGTKNITSKAARRKAMRDAGVPTSQPLIQDKGTKSSDRVFTTRDKKFTIQDAKNDRSHQGQPHWEVGPTKKDPSKPDGLNRSGNNNKPQMGKPKSKEYYNE